MIELRTERLAAGLSQRELARLSGVAQPNIAAYERGRRKPSAATAQRLRAALSTPTLAGVRARRSALVSAATARNLANVRVFGSVARGEARPGSDVDLLVQPGPTASLFDAAGFLAEAEEILRMPVDVVSDRATGVVADRIRSEAVPL